MGPTPLCLPDIIHTMNSPRSPQLSFLFYSRVLLSVQTEEQNMVGLAWRLHVCNSYEVSVQAGQTLATVLSSEAADTLSTPKSQQFGAGCVSGDVCATWQEEEGWYPRKQ